MPKCRNCGAFVTEDYVRVFAPDGTGVRVCPECPDKVRRGRTVRAARSQRRNGNSDHHGTTYDPEVATDGGEQ